MVLSRSHAGVWWGKSAVSCYSVRLHRSGAATSVHTNTPSSTSDPRTGRKNPPSLRSFFKMCVTKDIEYYRIIFESFILNIHPVVIYNIKPRTVLSTFSSASFAVHTNIYHYKSNE